MFEQWPWLIVIALCVVIYYGFKQKWSAGGMWAAFVALIGTLFERAGPWLTDLFSHFLNNGGGGLPGG